MIKNNLKPLLLCLSIPLFINSCTGDEEFRTSSSEIQNIRNNFSLKHFNDDVVKNKLSIHWDDFNIHQNSENEDIIYEFNTSFRAKNILENRNQTLTFTYKLLVFQNNDGSYSFELLKFLSHTTQGINRVSYFDPASFSGTVYYYNLQGETTKIEAYKDGVLQNEFSDEEKGVITAQSKAPYSGCENGCYVLVFTGHYTDYYVSLNGGGFSYSYSVYEGTTSEWVWVSNGSGGEAISDYHYHSDAPHGPAIGTNNHAGEHIVIDPQFSQEYPCQSQLVHEVYGNCAPLSQLFQDIFEGNDTFNVTFIAEDLNDIFRGAQTHGGLPNNYTIKLNTERLNQSTELDIVNTAAHEYVHATMLHYFYQGQFQLTGAGNPPTYAELAEGFAQHRADFYSEANQHEYMTSLVHDIAEVTYTWAMEHGYVPGDFASYDTDPADDTDGLKEFLRQLAWNGLTNTTTFQELYPDNTLEEQTIKKLIQDEAFPDDTDATPKGGLPVPCN